MRATVPVLLLVALAGCPSVLSASLEVAAKEDVSDERVEISDLQKSDVNEAEPESEDERKMLDYCFGKAERDPPEHRSKPTASSASEEMTEDTKNMSTTEEKPEDEGTEANAEVRVQTLDMAEEDSDEAEERFDIELLRHAGERDAAVE